MNVHTDGAVLRRSVVIPSDLFFDVQKLARADGFESVQAWIVVQVQKVMAARACAAEVTRRLQEREKV
jgi:hypothetical protein